MTELGLDAAQASLIRRIAAAASDAYELADVIAGRCDNITSR
jgi:hypothetical protein